MYEGINVSLWMLYGFTASTFLCIVMFVMGVLVRDGRAIFHSVLLFFPNAAIFYVLGIAVKPAWFTSMLALV